MKHHVRYTQPVQGRHTSGRSRHTVSSFIYENRRMTAYISGLLIMAAGTTAVILSHPDAPTSRLQPSSDSPALLDTQAAQNNNVQEEAASKPESNAAEAPSSSPPEQPQETVAGQSVESQSQTTVNINGETTTLPEDGSLRKVIESENGNTTIDISVSNSAGEDSRSSSSSTLRIDTRQSTRSSSTFDQDTR